MNGWSNHETWQANLRYGDMITEEARELAESRGSDEFDDACDSLTDTIAYWLTELDSGSEGLAGDLLNRAIAKIDCYELAETHLSDVWPDEDEDEDEEENDTDA